MAITTAYLVTNRSIGPFFDSLISAKAPSTFTIKFIEGLGFKSTNDRLFMSVLKGLGFLDSNAAPTERYFKFLDQTQSKKVMAEAIEEAYGDLFTLHAKAYELSAADIKSKLKTLTQGKHSDNVVGLMAATFKALSEYADWEKTSVTSNHDGHIKMDKAVEPEVEKPKKEDEFEITRNKIKSTDFHYNIQIHLPESRDEAVYDALFKSLNKHLL